MHMINEQEIEKMIATINPQLDESNTIQTGDTSLEKILKHYLFLQQCIEEITSQFSVTKEEVLYSQYYWLVHFKNQYFDLKVPGTFLCKDGKKINYQYLFCYAGISLNKKCPIGCFLFNDFFRQKTQNSLDDSEKTM